MKKVLLISVIFFILNFFIVTVNAEPVLCFGFDIIPKYVNNSTQTVITNIVPNSSASKNNINDGDVIKELNGKDVQLYDLFEIMELLYCNDKINVLFAKNNEPVEICADVLVSKEKLEALTYYSKFLKYFLKKNNNLKKIKKGFSCLCTAIKIEPDNLFYRYSRVEIVKTILEEINWSNNDLINILILDQTLMFDKTNIPNYSEDIGYSYEFLNDDDNVEKYYNKAVVIYNNASDSKRIYSKLAQYFYNRKCIEKSAIYYNKLLPLVSDEEKASIYFLLGNTYKDNDNIETALIYYNKYILLLKSNKEKMNMYLVIANYYNSKQEYSKSIKYWYKFLQLADNNNDKIIALQNILYAYDDLKNYTSALQIAQKILNINKNDIYTITYLLTYYYNRNNYIACIPYLTKLIYLNKEDKYKNYLFRALLYEKLKNYTNSYNDAFVVYNHSDDESQKITAVYIMVDSMEHKIANSLKNCKNYVKIPSWLDIAPSNFIYVTGTENQYASYWAERRNKFYNDIKIGMSRYQGNNLIKYYSDIIKREEKENNKYYYVMEVIRQNHERQLEYIQAQELQREAYERQRALQNQLINGLYMIKTTPQTYNMNIQHNIDLKGNVYHYY